MSDKNPKKLVRHFELRDAKVDKEKRTIDIPFSSEFAVDRWFGKEVLSHAADAVDLSRLNSGAPLLYNHNMNSLIGVVERAWIDSENNRGMATVRFSKNPQGEQMLNDVQDGILRNVSVGYQVNELVLSKRSDDDDNEYTATKWMPYEVSMVTCPADPTVGVGRAEELELMVRSANDVFEKKNKPVVVETPPATRKEEKTVDEAEKKAAELKAAADDAVKTERQRVAVVSALCRKHELGDLERELIDSGKTVDECRTAILERMGKKQVPVTGHEADLGLTDKEIRQYSFLKAIRAKMEPDNAKYKKEAGFEMEVSRAAEEKTGTIAKGVLIPFEILRQPIDITAKRDLSVGTSTAGGNLVATNLLASSYIELLRNKAKLMQLGAQSLTGLVGNLAIPRATGAATAYWVGEATDITSESDPAFDQVTFQPHTVGAYTQYSRKLMLQSSLDVEGLVRADLAAVIALEADRIGMYGLGSSGQPLGIRYTSGINTTSLAGSIPTWAEVVGMESKIEAANADVAVMSYLMNATSRGNLKVTPKIGSTFPVFLMDDDGMVNGYKSDMTNQVISGDYWFAVWSQLIYGFWSGLDVLVDPYSLAKQGGVRIIAHQDMDVAVRHPASFTRANNSL